MEFRRVLFRSDRVRARGSRPRRGRTRGLSSGGSEHVAVAVDRLGPVVTVAEADDPVPEVAHLLGLDGVASLALWEVVVRAVNVDRHELVVVEEVGTGARVIDEQDR